MPDRTLTVCWMARRNSHSKVGVFRVARLYALLPVLLFAPMVVAAESGRPDWLVIEGSTGCRVWNQVLVDHEVALWSGGCRDGLAEGIGVLRWLREDRLIMRYEGELRYGKPQGYGILTRDDGVRYEGYWRDGKADGVGQVELSSGYKYYGAWSAGCARDPDKRIFLAVGTSVDKCHHTK